MTISGNFDQSAIVRRLILYAQRAEDRRKGKKVDEKTLREDMEADSAMISGNAPSGSIQSPKMQSDAQAAQVHLSDLIAQLQTLQNTQAAAAGQPAAQPVQAAPTQQAAQVQVNFQQVVETRASLVYTVLDKVAGLQRVSQTQAETDRYRFDFSDGSTFKITDKWSGKSTTIWGDPHVDVSDVEGTYNGDFKDLKASDSQTTMMLLDGTRVTFSAQDSSVIQAVDIFKGSQHLGGTGQGSQTWDPEKGLFAAKVDQNAGLAASLPAGDVVYAGGDGTDWYTAEGKLLWGQTTAPAVTERPYAVMQLDYQQKISEQVTAQVTTQVNKQA